VSSDIADERVNVDVFDVLTVAFVLPVHATASGGLPNIDPVGGPVAGSSKPGGIHQGFQQQRTMPISAIFAQRPKRSNYLYLFDFAGLRSQFFGVFT
jgi:hypothetical protein